MKKLNYLFVLLAFLGLSIGANAQILRLNVQNGQKFTNDVNLTATLDIKAKGISMNIDIPVSATLKYEVVSENADTVILKTELDALKIDFDFMGQSFHFDSQKDSAYNGKWSELSEILNKPFDIHYTKYRKITNIVGLKEAFKSNKKLNNFLNDDDDEVVNEYDEDDDIVVEEVEEEDYGYDVIEVEEEVEFANEINDYYFSTSATEKSDEEKKKDDEKYFEALSLIIFPEKEIKKGTKWETGFAEDEFGNITTYYKVTKTSKTQTSISANSKINIDTKMFGKELKSAKLKKLSSSTQMVIDNQTGWLKSSNSIHTLSADTKIEGTDVTITITVKYDVIAK